MCVSLTLYPAINSPGRYNYTISQIRLHYILSKLINAIEKCI